MWDIKLKTTNEQQEKQTKILIDRDNRMVVTRGKGMGRVVKNEGGQIYGDGRGFDFVWWARNTIYRSCIIEMYT